jgi:hypothetical protein
MKNIHLLPTDKPSRLWITKLGNLIRCNDIKPIKKALGKNVNIYITSDEKIKDSNWVYDLINNFVFQINIPDPLTWSINEKKIILTTDKDLIKDGVQAIDDEFLKWLVKNPSCETIEIEKQMLCDYCGQENCDNLKCRGYENSLYYEIIIPKEQTKCYCGHTTYCDCGADKVENLKFEHKGRELSIEEVMEGRSSAYDFIDFDKQETLEEAAYEYSKNKQINKTSHFIGFKAGVKWQAENESNWFNEYQEVENYIINRIGDKFLEATPEKYNTASEATIALLKANWQTERIYSEEEVIQLLIKFNQEIQEVENIREWFEQFKKK